MSKSRAHRDKNALCARLFYMDIDSSLKKQFCVIHSIAMKSCELSGNYSFIANIPKSLVMA